MVGCQFPTYSERSTNCSCSKSILLIYDWCDLKNVPCTTNFFISTVFNHSPTECFISYEFIMDYFIVLYASFSSYWPDNILNFLEVSHICGRDVFLSWWRILELKQIQIQWNLDWPLFLLRGARMCTKRCLHSNMTGMLCASFGDPSQAIQKVLFWLWTEQVVFLVFVVDLVEEHVDLGGSQFSEPILERWCSAHASQENVVTLEFGSPCSPRSALFAHDLNRHGLQRVAPIYHEVFLCFHDKVFRNHLAHFLCLCQQRVDPIYHVPVQRWDSSCRQMKVCVCFTRFHDGLPRHKRKNSFFVKRIYIYLLRTRRFFHLARFSCQLQQRVVPIYRHDLGLELVGSIGNFQKVAQFLLLVVEHVLNPILFSTRVSKRSLVVVEVTCILLNDFSSFHTNNFRNTTSWKCFLKDNCIRSSLIECQILTESQDRCRPNIPRPDVFSMLDACIVHNAVHSNRSYQAPCDSCPWDPLAVRTLSVCCSNFDLLASILNWWWNVKWLRIRHDKCTGRSCSESQHCPVE